MPADVDWLIFGEIKTLLLFDSISDDANQVVCLHQSDFYSFVVFIYLVSCVLFCFDFASFVVDVLQSIFYYVVCCVISMRKQTRGQLI